ncbi:hypothetical protein AVEN_143218-1 [Araneus ventricosus]|uniref:Uncharacterized protein n=1 Tax=Araneus ventricosus TaxID=182803 RepID=A0A4Y2ADG5_ARAVE|nr:hypothetical protein AVEN_143218-1 [Araneus ventricosus]
MATEGTAPGTFERCNVGNHTGKRRNKPLHRGDKGVYSGTPGWVGSWGGFRPLTPEPTPTGGTRIDPKMNSASRPNPSERTPPYYRCVRLLKVWKSVRCEVRRKRRCIE